MKQRKFMHKAARKVVSFILIAALALTGVDVRIEPKLVDAAEKIIENNKKLEHNVKIVKELVNERTENSNTYLLSDGSKRTDIYNENIRYEDKGELVAYDATLTKLNKTDRQELNSNLGTGSANEYIAVNAKGDSKQYFPKELNKYNGVIMKNGKYQLEFTPVFERIMFANGVQNEGGKTDQRTNKILSLSPKVKEDTITYISENANIGYQYISMTNGVKENIILESKPDINEFTFKINTKRLYLELVDGYGGINLKDKKSGKNIGCIMPPNITDAKGNTTYDDIKYSLKKTKEETILKLVVNKDYLENSKLAYPIKIDPTPVWFNDKLSTAMVIDTLSEQNIHGDILTVANKAGATGFGYISEYRTYLDTSMIVKGESSGYQPSNIFGRYIESALLSIGEVGNEYPQGRIEIRKPQSVWDASTITWETQPEIGELIASFESARAEGVRHNIDITEWAQDLASGRIKDTGMVLIAPQEHTGIMFRGPKTTNREFMRLSITHREMSNYDASIRISAKYNEQSGKINIKVEDYDQSEQKTVTGYQVFKRDEKSDKFTRVAVKSDINEITEIEANEIKTSDFRICVCYDYDEAMPSNIVTLKRVDNISKVVFEQISMDTDGDGIEDGYEIWDFKTKWNEKDADGNYILDSDGDGLTDAYEVFYQGSNPAVAENFTEDSDGDSLSDIEEYRRGTDPHLADSDFDGINDLNDYGSTNPRKTDNPDKNE